MVNQTNSYLIRIKGLLDLEWSDWLEGVQIAQDEEHGETIITLNAADQAKLQGLLRKIHDLGLALIAVNWIDPDQESRN